VTKPHKRLALVIGTGIDQYHTRLVAGIRGVLTQKGVAVLICVNDQHVPGLPASLTCVLDSEDVCGVIALNAASERDERELNALLATHRIPAVRIGMSVPGVTCIRGDNFSGMQALMAHLLDECGVRCPVLVRGTPHQPDSAAREAVFRAALAERGIPIDEDLVITGNFWHDRTYQEMRQLLKRRRDMDAVVAANDESALGAFGALTDEGLRVPEDVLLTGFDNTELASGWPGLTTVDQDLEAQGTEAARHLLAEIDGLSVAGEVTVASRLVVRTSTAPLTTPFPERLDNAMAMARAAYLRLAAQDSVIAVDRALINCRTLDQIITALTACLDQLGVDRCFLTIRDSATNQSSSREQQSPGATSEEDMSRLVLDYRDGRTWPIPPQPFPTRFLLPEHLRGELGKDVLALQPLAGDGWDYGSILFERNKGLITISEVLYMDLSRTLEAVFANRALEQHAATLEQTVARRTAELEAEIIVRRQTEIELQRSLATDPLTGIANRRAFRAALDKQWLAHLDGRDELALLMVDVDLFKNYNDRYGHLKGDDALSTVADCLRQAACYPDDVVSRFGGEEFIVLLPHTSTRGAETVARRFRERLDSVAIPHAASSIASILTASVGISTLVPVANVTPDTLITAADQALYRAKEFGRNQVVAFSLEASPRGSDA